MAMKATSSHTIGKGTPDKDREGYQKMAEEWKEVKGNPHQGEAEIWDTEQDEVSHGSYRLI